MPSDLRAMSLEQLARAYSEVALEPSDWQRPLAIDEQSDAILTELRRREEQSDAAKLALFRDLVEAGERLLIDLPNSYATSVFCALLAEARKLQ